MQIYEAFEAFKESFPPWYSYTGIENPKSKSIYTKLNEDIEKWTGVFYIFIVYLTVPATVMPQLIITFYLYITTDLGSETFNLPFPIWCVL